MRIFSIHTSSNGFSISRILKPKTFEVLIKGEEFVPPTWSNFELTGLCLCYLNRYMLLGSA